MLSWNKCQTLQRYLERMEAIKTKMTLNALTKGARWLAWPDTKANYFGFYPPHVLFFFFPQMSVNFTVFRR